MCYWSFFVQKIINRSITMNKFYLIILLMFFSNKAFADKLFWKCYDDMLMSTITNSIQNVEKMKFKNANVYVDTVESTLKYWQSSKDLVSELSKGNEIKADFFIQKVLLNDDMIVATHRPFKKNHPDEYNVFNLDLKNKKLIKVTAINNHRYTKYFDCEVVPIE
jgi:hypothetical protein